MLAMLDQRDIDVMWPKMRELYDILDGWNVANSLLDEPTAIIDTIFEKDFQTLIGKNYRINVFNSFANFVFTESITRDHFKELCDKLEEQEIKATIRRFPKRPEQKIIVDLGENYLEMAIQLFELLKIK